MDEVRAPGVDGDPDGRRRELQADHGRDDLRDHQTAHHGRDGEDEQHRVHHEVQARAVPQLLREGAHHAQHLVPVDHDVEQQWDDDGDTDPFVPRQPRPPRVVRSEERAEHRQVEQQAPSCRHLGSFLSRSRQVRAPSGRRRDTLPDGSSARLASRLRTRNLVADDPRRRRAAGGGGGGLMSGRSDARESTGLRSRKRAAGRSQSAGGIIAPEGRRRTPAQASRKRCGDGRHSRAERRRTGSAGRGDEPDAGRRGGRTRGRG